jgi:hypothetical protein
MNHRPANEATAQERLWRTVLFVFSAVMGAFSLVDLDAGRLSGATGDAGIACLIVSLMNQFPMVRAIVGESSKRLSPEELQREAERLRTSHPWTERIATAGWTLLFGSLILRALGVD